MKYFIKYFLILFLYSSVCFSLPAPKYLSVDHWKNCVKTKVKGSASFVCLPSKKPKCCSSNSWKILTKNNLIDNCYKK